jgi:hypothetical protein
MTIAELVTRDLRLVVEQELPPFAVFPEVVMWGERFFQRASTRSESPPERIRYVEVFCYIISVL